MARRYSNSWSQPSKQAYVPSADQSHVLSFEGRCYYLIHIQIQLRALYVIGMRMFKRLNDNESFKRLRN